MYSFKGLVFVFLMGSSFFANATSYTVDLFNESQTSDLITFGSQFTDTWDLSVDAGTEVTLTFAPVNIDLGPVIPGGASVFFLHISDFKIDGSGGLVRSFLASVNPYSINVEGFSDGIAGGAYTVVSTVSAVPVPAAAWLFGSALIGLVSFSRRKIVLPA